MTTSSQALHKFIDDIQTSPDKYGLIRDLLARIEHDEVIRLWIGNIMADYYEMEKKVRELKEELNYHKQH